MRLPFFILLFAITKTGLAQDAVFKNDLKKIISFSNNDFKLLYDSVENINSESGVYRSKITLSGTSDNVIYKGYTDSTGSYPSFYSARIDSCDERKAEKLIKEWKKKIYNSLNESFEEKDFLTSFARLGTVKGVTLTAKDFDIKVYHMSVRSETVSLDKKEPQKQKIKTTTYYVVFLSIGKR